MNLKNSFHHEEHREHEDISNRYRMFSVYPKGDACFINKLLFFFVCFVVQLQFLE